MRNFLLSHAYALLALLVVAALLFAPNFNTVTLIVSLVVVIAARVSLYRTKFLEASLAKSRKKWSRPILLLMYCSFFVELFIYLLSRGSSNTIYAFFAVIIGAVFILNAHSIMILIRTRRMKRISDESH